VEGQLCTLLNVKDFYTIKQLLGNFSEEFIATRPGLLLMQAWMANFGLRLPVVHSSTSRIQDLLDAASLADGDQIIALGDIVDRGPDSPRVLEFFLDRLPSGESELVLEADTYFLHRQRFFHRYDRGFFGGQRLLRRGGFLRGGCRFSRRGYFRCRRELILGKDRAGQEEREGQCDH